MLDEILISICIPTYNRSELLNENLRRLLLCEEFDSSVELVISDNCSTDSTKEVVSSYIRKFPEKRIVYNRNEVNIRDKNFLKVLSLGNGEYLKLYNDYTCLCNDDLALMKSIIRSCKAKREQLFFYDNLRTKANKYDQIKIAGTDGFVRLVNNKITWISNFGCWREQLCELHEYDQYSNLQLLQAFWTLHLVSKTSQILVINMQYDLIRTHDRNRVSYNFFQVHVENYYSILNSFQKRGLLTEKTIRYDKYRTLSDFVGNSICNFLLIPRSIDFSRYESWKIVFKHFWNIPFFYIVPFSAIINKISKIIHHRV